MADSHPEEVLVNKSVVRHFQYSQAGKPKQECEQAKKNSKEAQPLTRWRAKDKHVSRLKILQHTIATHSLKSQGQAFQQDRNTIRHYSHSHTGEPRTGIVSRIEI